jgi:phage terminase small subunit
VRKPRAQPARQGHSPGWLNGLSAREERFCVEYIKNDYNGTEAWIASGDGRTSRSTAGVTACELLARPKIRGRIRELHKAALAKQQLTVNRVLQEISRIAFSDLRKFYDEKGNLRQLSDLDSNEAAAIASLEEYEEHISHGTECTAVGRTKKIKLWNKNQALEKLGEHLGLFESGGGKVPTLIVNIVRCRRLEKPPGENE